jgi:low affinity Fe/Cu permease
MWPQCFPRRWGRFVPEMLEMQRWNRALHGPLFCMRASFNRALTNAGSWLSRPEPVVAVGVYIGLWLIFDRESFNWQAVASIATLLMTLFIQRSEHRDTQAIHAKLDELLRAQGDAKKGLTTLDDEEPEQIEAFRRKVRAK